MWPQPLNPLSSLALSALVGALPLLVVLVLMGWLRKSGLLASACGLLTTLFLAKTVWGMPLPLAGWSIAFGFGYALWSILWLVFGGLWLYQLAVATGSFDLLREWIAGFTGRDHCTQAILVAFCFGSLLEGCAGFGAPVAITSFLLIGFGFERMKAITVSLIANTAPVAFGALGLPIVALAGVTGIEVSKLSAAVGRQLPFLSFVLPAYLAWIIAGPKGLRRSWPVALLAGAAFAFTQALTSNLWGPYATDLLSALISVLVVVSYLRFSGRKSAVPSKTALSARSATIAWLPWLILCVVMVAWSYFGLAQQHAIVWHIPQLHNGVFITLYQKPYAAIFSFQPLSAGTGVMVAVFLTALCLRASPRSVGSAGWSALKQLTVPALTVLFIVALAYLYNYSGMAYTVGAAVAHSGAVFPIVSSYLGWMACFLSGSDTAANLLFGNLQVAAAHQLHINPVLLAATNSSGAVAGKMISPQNIAIGVTTVGLIGQEGKVLHKTLWHSLLFAGIVGLIALLQAYYLPGMIP